MSRVRALARVNLAAIERNVGRLRRELTGATELCAVVKADGYGHGAAPAAATASHVAPPASAAPAAGAAPCP
ncbi:MAG: hypothetical protein V7607_6204 [Solirubrobacteraceae bacterium]